MPWEIDQQATAELRERLVNPEDAHLFFVTTNDVEIPAALRRDKNNKAPFMLVCNGNFALNPATNLPASPTCWVPPWGAKS